MSIQIKRIKLFVLNKVLFCRSDFRIFVVCCNARVNIWIIYMQNKIIGGFCFVGGVRNVVKLSTKSQLITFTRNFIAWIWDLCDETFRRSDDLIIHLMHYIGNLTWSRFLNNGFFVSVGSYMVAHICMVSKYFFTKFALILS